MSDKFQALRDALPPRIVDHLLNVGTPGPAAYEDEHGEPLDADARTALDRMCALLAEVEALKQENSALAAEIREHNDGCESACKARRDAGPSHCPFPAYGRDCPDCPRDFLIGMYSTTRAAAATATREG